MDKVVLDATRLMKRKRLFDLWKGREGKRERKKNVRSKWMKFGVEKARVLTRCIVVAGIGDGGNSINNEVGSYRTSLMLN